jgi:urease accessory protein
VTIGLQRLERSRGELRLEFKRRGPQSVLAGLYQDGCLKARMPRVRGGVPEAICINTSGGVTDGDALRTTVTCHAGASAVVSGQAAERVYRSRGEAGQIIATLILQDRAMLAWLPQETILFDGGRLIRSIDVHLCESASLFAVESTILGRTAMGERVSSGSFSERWRINVDGQLAYVDSFALEATDIAEQAARATVLDGRLAFATAIYVGRDAVEVLDCIRALDEPPDCLIGASCMGNIVMARLAGTTGQALRAVMQTVVGAVTGRFEDVCIPKVWML